MSKSWNVWSMKKSNDQTEIQVGKVKGVKEKCLGREKRREMKSDIVLKLFKQNVAQWIEDLSSSKSQQIKSVEVLLRIYRWQKGLDGLNNYREAIGETKTFLMDRKSVKKLSRVHHQQILKP